MSVHDLSSVYAGLKDFQLASVEHAAEQLFGGGGTGRFLVADEVGLGKTLVARGVIAKAIEHHVREQTRRIDIVYVCSNGDIARQNIRRLNVIEGHDFSYATRLTLLPRQLRHLQERRLNFVSFTPGTSFNLRSTEGIQDERALILNMLKELWGREVRWGKPGERVFAGYASFRGFANRVADTRNQHFDPALLTGFARELAAHGEAALRDDYEHLRERFVSIRSKRSPLLTSEVRDQRAQFVGTLRELLAHACVDALEPDLVILDEFQRFKHLFDPEDPAGALARTLFDYEDVGVLLLSATPYKMYTRGGEDGEDHYEDFLHTAGFLLRDDQERLARLRADIGAFRRSLFELHQAGAMDRALDARTSIEATLRTVMSRNERLAATANRSGMLTELACPQLRLTGEDIRRYIGLDMLSQRVDGGTTAAYWEATPYPLSFMEDYVFTRAFERAVGRDPGGLSDLPLEQLALPWEDIERFRRTDPGNARMRSIEADTLDRGMWRLLWMPPSLPYHTLGGPYADAAGTDVTKRLIFSAWKVVPTAVATYLTFDAERRMMGSAGESADPDAPAVNTPAGREAIAQRLTFARSAGRLNGMPVLALLYPSVTLAELGDPLAAARDLGALHEPAPLQAILDSVRDRVAARLAPLIEGREGRANDQRWYWAAPFLLDQIVGTSDLADWLSDPRTSMSLREGYGMAPDQESSVLGLHLEEAAALLREGYDHLGQAPSDLVDVIAELAIAGPGVCALRGLTRNGDLEVAGEDERRAAASIAWGLRSLFNDPAVTTMLSAEVEGRSAESAYWRIALNYCLEGGLQSVFDEWTHVLMDSLNLRDRPREETLKELSETMRTSLMAQAVTYQVRRVEQTNGHVELGRERMRAQFARRFGDDRGESDTTLQTAANVRTAFNSPFWPFVLATTSVGQEGLDFHTYCHAVVHWNLPSNPVDMEQREGRAHRYKGHAVRRNIASEHRAAAIVAEGDPWTAMFDDAARHRKDADDELVPYWVYAPEGGARIERYVPALPLSREAARLEELRKTTAAYRLVFGQPRQEDLIQFLENRTDGIDLDALKIDLRPPAFVATNGEARVDLTMLEVEECEDVAELFANDDDGYEAWLATHPTGYVLNCLKRLTPETSVLHRRSCWTVSGTPSHGSTWTTRNHRKIVAQTAEAIAAWTLAQIGLMPSACGVCRPTLPAVSSP